MFYDLGEEKEEKKRKKREKKRKKPHCGQKRILRLKVGMKGYLKTYSHMKYFFAVGVL